VAEDERVNGLEDLRKRIDALDDALVKLLNARAACALEIGKVKKQIGLAIYQPSREAEVLGHVQEINPGPLDDGAVRRLFERIIDEARRLERESAGRHDEREADVLGGGGLTRGTGAM
jgi:chorismate mutase